MQHVTTTFTEEELVKVGRAMERCGFVDLSEFLAWSAKQQTAQILAETKQD